MERCRWGECREEATEAVVYPARRHGEKAFYSFERRWEWGTDLFMFCEDCAQVARDEVANRWPKKEATNAE